jgi:hypothetical protein
MSRLSKQELIEQSIRGIFILLKEIRSNPDHFVENKVIVMALRSQGGLCKLDLTFTSGGQEYCIKPVSLNTLKQKLDNSETVDDFHYLNKERLAASEALTDFEVKPSKERKRTKSGLEDTVSELKSYIDILHATTDVLLQTIATSRRDLKTIRDTPNTGLRQKRIDDALQRMTLILSLNPEPFNSSTSPIDRKHLRLVNND